MQATRNEPASSLWPGRLLRMGGACVFISIAFWVAVAAYALLYLFLIPQHVHHVPVYFDYHARGPSYDLPGARGSGVGDFDRWGPTATVDLLAGRRGDWLDYGPSDSSPPSAAEACSAQRTRGAAPSLPSRRRLVPTDTATDDRYHHERTSSSSTYSLHSPRGGVQSYSGEATRPSEPYHPIVAAVAGPRHSGSALPAKASVLTSGVAYSIALELVLPNSPVNRNAGLVMVRADLHSAPTPAADSELRAVMNACAARRQRLRRKQQQQPVRKRQQQEWAKDWKNPEGAAQSSTCQSDDEEGNNESDDAAYARRARESTSSEGDFESAKGNKDSSEDESTADSARYDEETEAGTSGDESDSMEDDSFDEAEGDAASFPCVVLASARRATGNAWVDPSLYSLEALALAPLAIVSPWLRWWSSVLFGSGGIGGGGSLLGRSAGSLSMVGTQRVQVPLFEAFRESAAQPLSAITVTLGLPLQQPRLPLEVYAANLVITANLAGVRHFMYHWFFTSAVVGVGTLLVLQLALAAFAYAFYALTAPPAVASPGAPDQRFSSTRSETMASSPSSSSSSSFSERSEVRSEVNNNTSGTPSCRSDPTRNLNRSETQPLDNTPEGLEGGGVGESKESAGTEDRGGHEDVGDTADSTAAAALDSEEPNMHSSR